MMAAPSDHLAISINKASMCLSEAGRRDEVPKAFRFELARDKDIECASIVRMIWESNTCGEGLSSVPGKLC